MLCLCLVSRIAVFVRCMPVRAFVLCHWLLAVHKRTIIYDMSHWNLASSTIDKKTPVQGLQVSPRKMMRNTHVPNLNSSRRIEGEKVEDTHKKISKSRLAAARSNTIVFTLTSWFSMVNSEVTTDTYEVKRTSEMRGRNLSKKRVRRGQFTSTKIGTLVMNSDNIGYKFWQHWLWFDNIGYEF